MIRLGKEKPALGQQAGRLRGMAHTITALLCSERRVVAQGDQRPGGQLLGALILFTGVLVAARR